MNDYKELIERLHGTMECLGLDKKSCVYEAAKVIEQLIKERDTLRNELCLRCGEYTEAHNGACDGCRWRAE